MPISAIFAFKSDLTGDAVDELTRLLSVVDECGLYYNGPCKNVPGPITALCVVERGSWGDSVELRKLILNGLKQS